MQKLPNLLIGTLTIATLGLTLAQGVTAAPRRPLSLQDETTSNPGFAQFRTRLEKAVRDRDSQYLKTVLPKDAISIGFGRPSPINQLDLGNRNARFWKILDYTLAHSCGKSALANDKSWTCPTVNRDFQRQYPAKPGSKGIEHLLNQIIILGTNVNVRSEPNLNGAILTQVSNEILLPNPNGKSTFGPDPQMGWHAVTIPDGRTGFVNNRYVYFPLGYQLNMQPSPQGWKIVQIQAGD
jgi:hypothetical protein